jgi:hypothetical protein
VALPARLGGAVRVITLREEASSVAHVQSSTRAPCVLSSLGADAPGIHQPNREDH